MGCFYFNNVGDKKRQIYVLEINNRRINNFKPLTSLVGGRSIYGFIYDNHFGFYVDCSKSNWRRRELLIW